MHLKGLIISVSINYWLEGNSKSIAEEDLNPDSLQLGLVSILTSACWPEEPLRIKGMNLCSNAQSFAPSASNAYLRA